jgi:hypothetical protein
VRVLLDECIDRRFARTLVGHDVTTVPKLGWAGIKNGELMSLAEKDFDVFDRNLSYQQNLSKFDIRVVVLRAASNRFQDLSPFAEQIIENLSKFRSGEPNILSLD